MPEAVWVDEHMSVKLKRPECVLFLGILSDLVGNEQFGIREDEEELVSALKEAIEKKLS